MVSGLIHRPGQRLHAGWDGDLGAGLAEAIGPSLLIALCITWGRPGRYVVGMLFLLTGATVPLATRWARRQPTDEKRLEAA
jgi:hypothetical protein